MRLIAGTAEIDSLEAFLDQVDEIAVETGCTVQAFDARYVVGPEHLRRALTLADRAIERGDNVARERAVEVLVYAAGRRQIDDALEMGVSAGTGPVVVLVASEPDASNKSDRTDDQREETADQREAAAAERVASLVTDAREIDPDEGAVMATDPERVREFFGITDHELAATDGTLADVVTERVALLDVRK